VIAGTVSPLYIYAERQITKENATA